MPNRQLELSSDHDLLITLVATVNSNHASTVDSFSRMQQSLEEFKVGSNATLLEHERRLRKIEDVLIKIDLATMGAKTNDLWDWSIEVKRDHARKQRNFALLWTGISATLSLTLDALQHFGDFFGAKH